MTLALKADDLELQLLALVDDVAGVGDPLVAQLADVDEALEAIADAYMKNGRGVVSESFASSAALARQIENGAPADVFFSADAKWMDYLVRRGLIAEGTRSVLLHNRLALVAPAKHPIALRIAPGFPLASALGSGRLAIGDPEFVPAGIYAKAALVSLGVWKAVARKLAPAANVRAALTLAERGEAAAGIVYATDVAASRRVWWALPRPGGPTLAPGPATPAPAASSISAPDAARIAASVRVG